MKKILLLTPLLLGLSGCDLKLFDNSEEAKTPNERPLNGMCLAQEPPVLESNVKFEQLYQDLPLETPIQLYRMPNNHDEWFYIDRHGYVYKFDDKDDVSEKTLLLDISDIVESGYGEMGLLGMAFHPNYAENGKVYLYYAYIDPADDLRKTTISEYDYDNATGEFSNEVKLLVLRQYTQNHQGGNIVFGNDGYMYMAYGDDAKPDKAQQLDDLYGKMIRIDVPGDGTYSIPVDNPYVNVEGARGEIWASGFRHPWRWSIDRETGEIWMGDVGANAIEEVNFVEKGGNYGWPMKEGTQCTLDEGCSAYPDIIDPVLEFTHEAGWGAIIGGATYRGDDNPGLVGKYIFADFSQFSRILSLEFDGESKAYGNPLFEGKLASGGGIHAFTEDHDGELIITHLKGFFKMVPDESAGQTSQEFPQTLTETGCFSMQESGLEPVDAAVPFDVASSLYTDGADKRRWMSLPDNTQIEVTESGDFIYPIGSVLIKEFALGGKKIETRLLMKNGVNEWNGYTYEWNDEQTEAHLLPAGKTVMTEGIAYKIPNRIQCQNCHNDSINGAVGPEFRQLNIENTYPNGNTLNQIDYLAEIGLIPASAVDRKEELPALPDYHVTTYSDKARMDSFLHSNCAYCHNPTGPARGDLDFRYQALPYWNACNKDPQISDLGIEGAKLIAAGDPEKSIIYKRVNTTELEMMPPIGRTTIQNEVVELMHSFISNTRCE